ncbi:uncharacterized protein IL334_001097 [Kwoniella shivajii]|uniref:Zn(2)-C6 fungal-type domain-containing protein n=1 Tax=Kwoniella shivajii TaxID=564305 RepID=A0ABZ1CRL1_9TREE|nr:hypothetical protein IL334_001097 [Kwoniella shivajii]
MTQHNPQGQQYVPYDAQLYQFSSASASSSSIPPHSPLQQHHQPFYSISPSRPSTSTTSPETSFSYSPHMPVGIQSMSYSQPQPQAPGQININQYQVNYGNNLPPTFPEVELEVEGYMSDPDLEGGLEVELEQSKIFDNGTHDHHPPLPSRRETYGSLSGSTDSMVDGEIKEHVAKRKPRITLPRGRACVACSKCTGDAPCKTCQKAGLECRYEELPRKKPRAVILEERVAELEACLNLRPNDPVPSRFPNHHPTLGQGSTEPSLSSQVGQPFNADFRPHSAPSIATPTSLLSTESNPPILSLTSHMASLNPLRTDIAPNSALELSLIQTILPFAPFIGIPLHSARFLALLALPPSDLRRPHPALLYILFAQAIRILELNRPIPKLPSPPSGMFPPSFASPIPLPEMDRNKILSQMGGTSLMLLERSRLELDKGIRAVDRPFDLTRAATGIAWLCYSMGNFIEGWNIPVSRLLISCGLHRITGTYIPPDGGSGINPDLIPKPYAPSHQYSHSHSLNHTTNPFSNNLQGEPDFPSIRMRPIIIPPARDSIDLAERVATFWAAKMQDWEAGIGWGWSISLSDDLCTTQWAKGWGAVEVKPENVMDEKHSIRDLYDQASPMHSSTIPDTTYTLAIKSLALLHRSSALFDLPESSYPIPLPNGTIGSPRTAPLTAIQTVQIALRNFRHCIPEAFQDFTQYASPPSEMQYDGLSDPWWIMFHANLYTAEMLCWREMANHRPNVYETAVRGARALVNLVRRVPIETWPNLDLIVALDLSLTSRFLFKESDRLLNMPQSNPDAARMASMASSEAEVLTQALVGPFDRFNPIAGMHSLIVQRVREGWPEKEGEYERI